MSRMRAFINRFRMWWSGRDSHVAELMRGASVAGMLKAVSAVLGFALNVVLGRMLGADTAGAYFLALTAVTIAATVGRVGMDSVVLRLVAAHSSNGNWAAIRNVSRSSLTIGVLVSLVATVALVAGDDLIATGVFSDANLSGPIRWMSLAVVPLALGVLVSRALLGLARVGNSILVFSVIPYGVSLIGTWALAPRWGLSGAIAAYVIGVALAFLYGWLAWRTVAEPAYLEKPAPSQLAQAKELVDRGTPLLVGALLQLVIQTSGTVALGIWSGSAQVSQFSVAWRTALLTSFVLLAVNTIAQPKFAELHARGENEALAATANRATVLMTLLATPIFLVLVAVPELVMSAFGKGFAGGAATLQILSVGHYVNVITGSVGILLLMSGHERLHRNVQIAAATVVVVLNVLLTPKYGAVGAAIAAAAALIVQNVLCGYLVWRTLGILMFLPRSICRRKDGES